MYEEWRSIEAFPGYSVSEIGLVRNDDSNRYMTMCVNQAGVVHVGLTRNRIQYKRAVALLVATAFEIARPFETCDVPINLDGNRYNNNVNNLAWRPKWFATKYFNQFLGVPLNTYRPVKDVETKEQFYNAWSAVVKFGLLYRDIMLSTKSTATVWPTHQKFELVA
jgi:hypothetical protein